MQISGTEQPPKHPASARRKRFWSRRQQHGSCQVWQGLLRAEWIDLGSHDGGDEETTRDETMCWCPPPWKRGRSVGGADSGFGPICGDFCRTDDPGRVDGDLGMEDANLAELLSYLVQELERIAGVCEKYVTRRARCLVFVRWRRTSSRRVGSTKLLCNLGGNTTTCCVVDFLLQRGRGCIIRVGGVRLVNEQYSFWQFGVN